MSIFSYVCWPFFFFSPFWDFCLPSLCLLLYWVVYLLIDLYECFYMGCILILCQLHTVHKKRFKMLHSKHFKGHQVKRLLSDIISEHFLAVMCPHLFVPAFPTRDLNVHSQLYFWYCQLRCFCLNFCIFCILSRGHGQCLLKISPTVPLARLPFLRVAPPGVPCKTLSVES